MTVFWYEYLLSNTSFPEQKLRFRRKKNWVLHGRKIKIRNNLYKNLKLKHNLKKRREAKCRKKMECVVMKTVAIIKN